MQNAECGLRNIKKDKRLEKTRTGLGPVILNPFPMELWIKARKKSLDIGLPMTKIAMILIDRWVKGEIKI